MNKMFVGALCGLVLSTAEMGQALAQGPLPLLELSAGMYRIEAEVAANDQHRQVGLMNRKTMPAQRGMLFVFPQERAHCMWMRNTLIPLSVAFIDADGYIINIENMQPQTEDNHCAKVPARYALEMNEGWFAQRGIKPGFRLQGIDKAPRPQ